MFAAIYARKSTEQRGVADDSKSVTRQVENARKFASAKGWTVLDEHIYIDDGISGAELDRPGWLRVMDAAQRQKFQILVVSEQKSISRETADALGALKSLRRSGVTAHAYMNGGERLTARTSRDKMNVAFRAMQDESVIADASYRVHEAHERIHSKGHVVGGRVFGYRNVDVFLPGMLDEHGRPKRSHVDREVKDPEALVVRRMFEMYASGLGLKSIAKVLTADQAACPRPLRRADGQVVVTGWSPGSVRNCLRRELYRGVAIWNRTKKRNEDWEVDWQDRPESEWKRIVLPELRIVSEELWSRVQTRLRDVEGRIVRFGDGRISGRPPKHDTKNLLAGLATCGVCGGGMVVETSARKGKRASQYVCHRRRVNGSCSNAKRMNVQTVNEAVLQAIEEHALTPEAIEQVVRLSERDDHHDRQERLRRELQHIDQQIGHAVTAITKGIMSPAVVDRLRALEADKVRVTAECEGLRPVPRLAPAVVADRLAEWRRLLRQSTTQGRAVLQRVLQGRITLTPTADGYGFEAPTRYDRLFAGIAVPRPDWVPSGNVGAEQIAREDTPDQDYGQLLANVDVKGMASPTGFEPVFQP